MPFDGITAACIVKELTAHILGGKIEKVYQPAPEEIILNIHGERQNHRLLISAAGNHARIHLVKGASENPPNPPAFCMLLRKHLQNGRIRGICQKNSERIIEIPVDSLDEMGFSVHKKLIIEIMGKHSNISLVNTDTGKVLDSIKRISGDINRYRQLLPGVVYVYPPSQNKTPFWSIDSPDKLKEVMCGIKHAYLSDQTLSESASEQTVSGFADTDINKPVSRRLLDTIQGVSPFFAEALCASSGISPSSPVSSVSDDLYKSLYAPLQTISDKLQSQAPVTFDSVVYLDEQTGEPVDFYPFDLFAKTNDCENIIADAKKDTVRKSNLVTGFDASKKSNSILHFDTLSMSLEYYFENMAASGHMRQKSADLSKIVGTALDKLYLKKKRLKSDLDKASCNDDIKLMGELLTANIYRLKQGDEWAVVDNYYDGNTVKIPLDPRLSPSQNVQKYYKMYNKAKTAIREKGIQLEDTNLHIAYLESVLTFIENAEEFSEISDIKQELIEGHYIRKRNSRQDHAKNKDKPKKSALKPHTYTTSEGFRLSVGRNNKQNDMLTLKTASSKDIWFHTKDIPGSHVILFTEGKEPKEVSLREAAAIAAYHSKSRQSDNVPVDYTAIKHVRKPAGAKPGMVIYDHHRTLYVSPAEPKHLPKD